MLVDEIAREAFVRAVQDETELRTALLEADGATILMLTAHLTGDPTLLEQGQAHITGTFAQDRPTPRSLHEDAVDLVVEALRRLADGGPAPELTEADFNRIVSLGAGEEIPPEFVPLARSEAERDSGEAPQIRRPKAAVGPPPGFYVVVIGAGVSGIAAGVRLRDAGIPFVILDRNAAPGGAWRETNYPGCGLDVPLDAHAYSFFPNTILARPFAKRDDILDYLQACIDTHDLDDAIVSNANVIEIQFLASTKRWQVVFTTHGIEHTLRPNLVISAVGELHTPKIPPISGLDLFAGDLLHTAAWDDQINLAGRRVAVIGAGSSGSQVAPALAPKVAHLEVFQRHAHWRVPDPTSDRARSAGDIWAQRHVPYFAAWRRVLSLWTGLDRQWNLTLADSATSADAQTDLIRHVERELGDRPDLVAAATPTYRPGALPLLRDDRWFRMLGRDNVSLVTSAIVGFTPEGILTADGVEHAVDAVIFATGFGRTQALRALEVFGAGAVDLGSVWSNNRPRAYLGVAAPQLPNFFMLLGPDSVANPGGGGPFVAECQMDYILQAIQELADGGYAALEVRQSVHDDYSLRQAAQRAHMCWSSPGVSDWGPNAAGRETVVMPWRLVDFWHMTRRFNPGDYHWSH